MRALASVLLVVLLVRFGTLLLTGGSTWLQRTGRAIGGLAVLLAVGSAVVYVVTPSLRDHVEANLVSIAWMAHGGAPIFHAVDAAPRYSTQYGPLVYDIIGVSLAALGPSLVSAKLPGMLALAFTFVALWWTLRRLAVSSELRLALLGIFGIIACAFGAPLYWARPDPFLIALTALAAAISTLPPSCISWLLLGLCAGFAAHLKIHAFLPMIALAVPNWFADSHRPRAALSAGAGLLAGVVLPLLPGNIDIASYAVWIALARKHGFGLVALIDNLCIASALCAPVILLLRTSRQPATAAADRVQVVLLVGAILLTSAVAAKHGAGMHHLLPSVVATLVVSARLVSTSAAPVLRTSTGGLLTLAVFLLWAFPLTTEATALGKYVRDSKDEQERCDESLEVARTHPGRTVEMGYGIDAAQENCRPLLVFQGQPHLIDDHAVMDMEASGLSTPRATADALRRCEVGIWLVPRDERPFSMLNNYTNRRLFDLTYMTAFSEAYERTSHGKWYDLWECRRDRH
jgi:hypothetical protein